MFIKYLAQKFYSDIKSPARQMGMFISVFLIAPLCLIFIAILMRLELVQGSFPELLNPLMGVMLAMISLTVSIALLVKLGPSVISVMSYLLEPINRTVGRLPQELWWVKLFISVLSAIFYLVALITVIPVLMVLMVLILIFIFGELWTSVYFQVVVPVILFAGFGIMRLFYRREWVKITWFMLSFAVAFTVIGATLIISLRLFL